VSLEFLGAPILDGLIAARRPSNIYGWLWCMIGVGAYPRWRPVAWLILVLAVALPLEGAVSPGSLQLFPFLDNPVGVTGGALGWLVEAFGQVGFQLFLATLPAAALALALRFHRSRGVERQQLKWFAAAGLTLVAVPVADTISPSGSTPTA